MSVILIGFMGAGKTAVGRIVAERMGLPFIDLDDRVAAAAGMPVPDLFREGGEAAFRTFERNELRRAALSDEAVVATGGGIVTQEAVREALKQAEATVVYLETTVEDVTARVGDGEGRPLFSDDPAEVEALLQARVPLYEEVADATVATSGLDEAGVADAVMEALGA